MLLFLSIPLAINVLGILSGNILTENKRFSFAKISNKLDRKPFNCKPCLTFHILWILHTLTALLYQSWIFFTIGLISSLAIFGVLYIENKFKIVK
jgi:hypothetical protein